MISTRASHHQRRLSGSIRLSQLARVIFAQKEVHVVELNRVGAISSHQVVKNLQPSVPETPSVLPGRKRHEPRRSCS